jgi:alpha-L-rhamnosidase
MPAPSSPHPWPDQGRSFTDRGVWPAAWISIPDAPTKGMLAAYRLVLTADRAESLRVFVSADERFDLFLDGIRVARGPERGDPANWYFQAVDLDLGPGEHHLVARVWTQGLYLAPWSHVGLHHGFILAAADPALKDRLNTGHAPWQGLRLDGVSFPSRRASAWHSHETIDGSRYPWSATAGGGDGWAAVTTLHAGRTLGASSFIHTFEHALRPGSLPPLLNRVCRPGRVVNVDRPAATDDPAAAVVRGEAAETAAWQALWSAGQAVTVPPQTRIRVLVDLDGYFNAYVHWQAHGGQGARILLDLGERLATAPGPKPQPSDQPRGDWEGRFWPSGSAAWTLDGAAHRDGLLWWRSGRWLKVEIATGDEPLVVDDLHLEETRFPIEDTAGWASDDAGLDRLLAACVRTLQCCMHESFMDCPWYEQQFWVGDARMQMLLSHHLSTDDSLVRRCLTFLADTRWPQGPVMGRYPAPQRLCIPSFALGFNGMVSDFARYRGDPAFVTSLMPAVRATLDWFLSHRDAETGLVRTPRGWDFTDWVEGWAMGEPPHGTDAPGAILNWWLVGSLEDAAELEQWLGEPELSARWRRLADDLATASDRAFWVETEGLYATGLSANDQGHRHRCEHSQVQAALCRSLPAARRERLATTLPEADGRIDRTNLFFDFYTVQALARLGRHDRIWARLERYRAFAALGLFTTPETAGATRSDCHAWSAHPRLDAVRLIAGLEPAGPGATAIRLDPVLGHLTRIETALPLPAGMVRLRIERTAGACQVDLDTPVPCHLRDGRVLAPGRHRVELG